MSNDTVQIAVELVPSPSADDRVAEQQTQELAAELRGVRGVAVERATTVAPEDAKSVDFAAIGSLLVSLSGAGGPIAALVGVLGGWVNRESGRKIRVKVGDKEIELTGANQDQAQQLIDAFTASVADG